MSDATKAALDEAVATHVADEADGAIVTGYVLQADYTSLELADDRRTGYLRETPERQPLTQTIGLIHYASRQLDHYMTSDGNDLD